MRELFSTAGLPPASAFKRWREAVVERFTPIDIVALGPGPFAASMEGARVGDVDISRMASDPIGSDARCVPKGRFDGDMLVVNVVAEGSFSMQVGERDAVVRRGGFVVNDSSPWTFASRERSETLSIEVPRRRFEAVLGPSRLYAGLGVDGALGGASLATGFLHGLLRVEAGLDAASRVRMASIAQDLFIAAVAERLGRDTPAAVADGVVVQRAKACIEARFRDPGLTPDLVAGASGVSLRRLQELFARRHQSIAGWIWERRLAAAVALLEAAPTPDRAIGDVAVSCGFTSHAHFSTRFKARFGLTPRDFRLRAVRGRLPGA